MKAQRLVTGSCLRPVRMSALAMALALVAGAGMAGSAAAAPAAPTVQDPAPPPAATQDPAAASPKVSTSTVTLLTGDRFQVDVAEDGTQQTRLLPDGTDAAGGTFSQFTFGGDTYVVPAEAAPYFGKTIDPRLFNVGYLVRAELDDEHTKSLPVKVKATAAKADALPATSLTKTTGGTSTAKVTKKNARDMGRLLAERWRDAGTSAAAGMLPGVERIDLAVPKGAPEPPPSPTSAQPALAQQAGKQTKYRALTIDSIGQDGKPGVMIGFAHNVDDGRLASFGLAYPGEGKKSFMVPEGTYSFEVSVFTGPGSDLSTKAALVVKPEVRVTSDMTITLDARTAVPYQANLAAPPRPDMPRLDALSFVRTSAAGDTTGVSPSGLVFGILMRVVSFAPNGNPTLFATPTQPVTKGRLDFMAMTTLAEGATGGPEMGSTYELLFPYGGAVPASMTHTIKASDLTTVHSALYDSPSDDPSPGPLNKLTYAFLPWGWTDFGFGAEPGPGERTDYLYSSRPEQVVWQSAMGPDRGERIHGPRRRLQPGQVIREDWNRGPDAPSVAAAYVSRPQRSVSGDPDSSVPDPFLQVCTACRQGNLLLAYLQPYSDSDPLHYAYGGFESSAVEFYRDGKLAYTGRDFFPAPAVLPLLPRPAEYRLNWASSPLGRADAPSSTDWTFRSGPGDAAAALPGKIQCADATLGCSFLPLLFVHYDLALDFESRVQPGRAFEVAFKVSRQESQPAPSGVRATVEVSYDDGETWSQPQDAPAKAGGMFAASVTHPDYTDAGRWVSLRVQARDADGNTVTQTNIHAYRLAG